MTAFRNWRILSLVGFFVLLLLVTIAFLYGDADRRQHATKSRSTSGTDHMNSDTSEKLTHLPKLGPGSSPKKSDEAYVTLQYGDFFLATRVLGQSLRDSGTTRDMVALCMPDVPAYQRETLAKEGWIVRSVDPFPKECLGDHVYSLTFVKIHAWLLTEYRRVIAIDSDAIALKNIDALFNCGEFCATFRHSDLFNAGVVVLKPSVDTFKSMCNSIQSIGSYTNGDQGFLNVFYKDLRAAPMFLPERDVARQEVSLQRLPSEYNSDVFIFYMVNKWVYLDTDEPYVLHYTLGPVKPWCWWSYPLFPLNWRWKALRDKLPPMNINKPTVEIWNSYFPIVLLLAIALSAKVWCGCYTALFSNKTILRWAAKIVHPVEGWFVNIFPTLTLLLAFYLAFGFVPLTMSPLAAWTQYGTWVLMFFSLPFSTYCHVAYVTGMHSELDHSQSNENSDMKQSESSDPSTAKQIYITPLRVAMESVVWLLLSVSIFYMQFVIPSLLVTMIGRSVSFFGLGLANLVMCYWYGKRLAELCYNLGLATLQS